MALHRPKEALQSFVGPTLLLSMVSVAAQGAVGATNFLTTVIVGRLGGEGELGTYVLGLAVVLTVAGVQGSLVSAPYTFFRQRVEDPGPTAYAGGALIHHGILAAFGSFGLAMTGVVVAVGGVSGRVVPVIVVLALTMPLVLLNQFGRRFNFAHHRVGTVLMIDLTVGALQIGSLLSLGLAGRLTAVTALVTLGVANGLAGGVWLIVSRRHFSLQREAARKTLPRHWRFGRWDLLASLMGIAHLYGIYWLLALNEGSEAIGIFAASLSVVSVSNPVIVGVGNVLTPRVADAKAKHGDEELWRVVKKAAILGVGLLSVPTVLLVVMGEGLIEFVYGSAYGGQGVTVAFLAVSVPFWWGEIAATNGLGALERSGSYSLATFSSLALTMGSGVLLVPAFGLPGAAAALAVGGVAETLIDWDFLRRSVHLTKERAA